MSDAPAQMSQREAEVITEQIVGRLDQVAENIEAVQSLMRDALQRRAHLALGYDSPTAYMRDRFEGALVNLSAALRREIVHELSDAGMSTRAIAPIVGVSQMQVVRDAQARDSVETNVSPSPRLEEPQAQAAADTPPTFSAPPQPSDVVASQVMSEPVREVVPAPISRAPEPAPMPTLVVSAVRAATDVLEAVSTPETRTVSGLDGKNYTVPVQQTPRRRPITDQARDAGWDVRKIAERIQRLREDDRLTRNKEEVAALLRHHLTFVIDTCQGLLEDLNQSQED